jgi:hypothetical protein
MQEFLSPNRQFFLTGVAIGAALSGLSRFTPKAKREEARKRALSQFPVALHSRFGCAAAPPRWTERRRAS